MFRLSLLAVAKKLEQVVRRLVLRVVELRAVELPEERSAGYQRAWDLLLTPSEEGRRQR